MFVIIFVPNTLSVHLSRPTSPKTHLKRRRWPDVRSKRWKRSKLLQRTDEGPACSAVFAEWGESVRYFGILHCKVTCLIGQSTRHICMLNTSRVKEHEHIWVTTTTHTHTSDQKIIIKHTERQFIWPSPFTFYTCLYEFVFKMCVALNMTSNSLHLCLSFRRFAPEASAFGFGKCSNTVYYIHCHISCGRTNQ